MKHCYLIAVLALASFNLLAQDIIYKNDGSELKAKVYEIKSDTIKYYIFEGLQDSLLDIPVNDIFMIIYENGDQEVFKTQEQAKAIDTLSALNTPMKRSSGLTKNNISFIIEDNRPNKQIIGKQPGKLARGVGLIIQPLTEIKDPDLKIYNYAIKNLSQILHFNGFQEKRDTYQTLKITINDLFSKTETGLYGISGEVTQNCSITVQLKDKETILFQEDLKSLYSGGLNEFNKQVEFLYMNYFSITSKKQFKTARTQDFKTYANKGYFIDFIIVLDDLISQLNNNEFFMSYFNSSL